MENVYSIKVARMYSSGRCKGNRWCWHWGHHEGRIHVSTSAISSLYVMFLSILIPPQNSCGLNKCWETLSHASITYLWPWQWCVCVCVCVLYPVYSFQYPLQSAKMFYIMRVDRARCIPSNLDGGGVPRCHCLLLLFSLHSMFSLHLLHKYKHSREEHKEEEKEYTNMQNKENSLYTPLKKNRERVTILKF